MQRQQKATFMPCKLTAPTVHRKVSNKHSILNLGRSSNISLVFFLPGPIQLGGWQRTMLLSHFLVGSAILISGAATDFFYLKPDCKFSSGSATLVKNCQPGVQYSMLQVLPKQSCLIREGFKTSGREADKEAGEKAGGFDLIENLVEELSKICQS